MTFSFHFLFFLLAGFFSSFGTPSPSPVTKCWIRPCDYGNAIIVDLVCLLRGGHSKGKRGKSLSRVGQFKKKIGGLEWSSKKGNPLLIEAAEVIPERQIQVVLLQAWSCEGERYKSVVLRILTMKPLGK